MVPVTRTSANQSNRRLNIKRPYCLGCIPTGNTGAYDYHAGFAHDYNRLSSGDYGRRFEQLEIGLSHTTKRALPVVGNVFKARPWG
jgi:hypothetical protein